MMKSRVFINFSDGIACKKAKQKTLHPPSNDLYSMHVYIIHMFGSYVCYICSVLSQGWLIIISLYIKFVYICFFILFLF